MGTRWNYIGEAIPLRTKKIYYDAKKYFSLIGQKSNNQKPVKFSDTPTSVQMVLHTFFFSVRFFYSTHENTSRDTDWSFLIYMRISLNQIVIQTTIYGFYYSNLQRKSINYHLFMLSETENMHFKIFCMGTLQEYTQMKNKKLPACILRRQFAWKMCLRILRLFGVFFLPYQGVLCKAPFFSWHNLISETMKKR